MRGRLGSRIGALALAALLAAPARAELDAEDVEIRVLLAEQQAEMETLLADWVDRNTGTWNTAGLEAFAPLVAEQLTALGFEVSVEPGVPLEYPGRKDARTGPLIVAQRKAQIAPERARHFLLVGHADSVFEPDAAFQKFSPDPLRPRRALGPGVIDMKGGLVVMLYALRALAGSGDLARADYTVLVNSDEEIGSLGSRPRIEAEAKRAQIGFVFEPSPENGEMARSRSGVGQFQLSVEGVASHVATSQRDGRSAIVALARKVINIESLTDYERGVILNVGTISGGTKRNIVPAHAEAWIDLRYDELAQGQEVQRELERGRGNQRLALGHAAPAAEARDARGREAPRRSPPGLGRAALPGARARALRRRHRRLDHGRGRPSHARFDGRAWRRCPHGRGVHRASQPVRARDARGAR
ncbi:MAG: M20 family metallopeptidase, partial [Deltaproteobacteria bacterium]|nr:M20 family metallopeptidase [Deltaproteobacteria bacterium]